MISKVNSLTAKNPYLKPMFKAIIPIRLNNKVEFLLKITDFELMVPSEYFPGYRFDKIEQMPELILVETGIEVDLNEFNLAQVTEQVTEDYSGWIVFYLLSNKLRTAENIKGRISHSNSHFFNEKDQEIFSRLRKQLNE